MPRPESRICYQCRSPYEIKKYPALVCSLDCLRAWFNVLFQNGIIERGLVKWRDEYLKSPNHPMLLVNMVLNEELPGEVQLKLMQHSDPFVARLMQDIAASRL